jgi:ubiquinone/menaquinone biosynthesis C-methylase UbiE
MTEEGENESGLPSKISLYDRAHLKIIAFIHDFLLGRFIDPYRQPRAAGLKPGQKVLELGPGPGFFTVPAAEIVGNIGQLYSLDINPASVKRVKERVEAKGLTNVRVMLADASKTSLPDSSFDVIFLFGVIHDFRDLDLVLKELCRVLKRGGILSVQSRWSENKLLASIQGSGLFRYVNKESRVYRLEKNVVKDDERS